MVLGQTGDKGVNVAGVLVVGQKRLAGRSGICLLQQLCTWTLLVIWSKPCVANVAAPPCGPSWNWMRNRGMKRFRLLAGLTAGVLALSGAARAAVTDDNFVDRTTGDLATL